MLRDGLRVSIICVYLHIIFTGRLTKQTSIRDRFVTVTTVCSMASTAGTSRDPYELERLAEELATRERAEAFSANHDLPLHLPLSHQNPFLTADSFNVEEFLLSRSHTSLQDLRSELRDYLSTLKEELVKLINDDYEAFISLSTDLRGEGARLERLKAPLGTLRAQILVCSSAFPL